MFLRCRKRPKDGKEHLYWSVVENRRLHDGRVVLYLGELNGRQEASWRKSVEFFGQQDDAPRQVALFPDGHAPAGTGADELTPRAALERFAAVQMLDVHLPTTDGREIILSRCTHPEKELQLLLDQLKLTLPGQPPPGITAPPKH